METHLAHVDYIYTEVNSDAVYENATLIGEMDDYLKEHGFTRVETNWHCQWDNGFYRNCKWGDAFYIKNIITNTTH
jgi:hypothetical protein